jgi:hypothetical protein
MDRKIQLNTKLVTALLLAALPTSAALYYLLFKKDDSEQGKIYKCLRVFVGYSFKIF